MKLKANYFQSKEVMPGSKAAILEDALHGNVLVIHSGNLITQLKLSDITAFLVEQDKASEPKEPVDASDS